VRSAFDVLVKWGIASPMFNTRAGHHGVVQDFRYYDAASAEQPFAFIANRAHLLFYVRKAGVRRTGLTSTQLVKFFESVTETAAGEFTIRLRSPEDAQQAIDKILTRWVPGPSTSSASEAWDFKRANPRTAESVISRALGSVTSAQRHAILSFLAESIRWASERANDRWGVTLWSDLVRFNVGFVHCVNVGADSMTVLVHRDPRVAGVKLEPDTYRTADGGRLAVVPYKVAERVLPLLLEQHNAAMTAAARRRPTPQIRGAHSQGVVDYLWDALALVGEPPMPSYVAAVAEPAPRDEPRLTIEAQHAVMALPDLEITEKLTVVKARLAQTLFRSRLAAADCRCRVTGVTERNLLRASHIRPWAKSNDRQRQDPNNGLLLAPHVDLLFDAGYLTFEDDGTVRIADCIGKDVLKAWGLHQVGSVAAFSKAQGVYLAYHREHVFVDSRLP
jgi:hypothetical protein